MSFQNTNGSTYRDSESKLKSDMTATISEVQSDSCKCFCEFFMVYMPRNAPRRYDDLYEDYIKKLSASRKRAKTETKDLPIFPSGVVVVNGGPPPVNVVDRHH
uniref:Uncharacterized protein n=1 Tax=Tanacetum cinerariifolium TaxID=118510 RepID=A0A699K358_TANCI|nr:hypothetical protein [Tanacetum cinerariifolium]